MKKLNVIYAGWGEKFVLGTLADKDRQIVFEYSEAAMSRGLQLSPHKLPLRREAYSNFPAHQEGLPGLISDALPDGWGALLMDRLFRKRGWRPEQISPLDRLAFIGDKAMGALLFEPPSDEELVESDIELLRLALDTREVLEDETEALLLKLALMGGSPHGARPKVLLHRSSVTDRMTNFETEESVPVLVKFPALNEHKEVCVIEAFYNQLARRCGLKVPDCQSIDLSETLSAFIIERFDRHQGMRVPMHTVAGAAHVDFRVPQLDCTALLRLTSRMTGDVREVLRAFERCVFNVVFNNRDDHSKNFSFLLSQDGRWQVSPAYDLTFCVGPNGEHQMDICGEARQPGRKHLLQLAKLNTIDEDQAQSSIERIARVAKDISEMMVDLPIRDQTRKQIVQCVLQNCSQLK